MAVLVGSVASAGSDEADGVFEYPFEDFGLSIILPGLINLHAHLEYSALRCFNTEDILFDWIKSLMCNVRSWTEADFRSSARSGLRWLAASGTTCVVDSSYTGQAAHAIAECGLRGVVGLELFGSAEKQAQNIWGRWLEKRESLLTANQETEAAGLPRAEAAHATQACLRAGSSLAQALDDGRVSLTVAPHAPYTVCPSLMRLAVDWAQSQNQPVLVHLSESKNERDWFCRGDAILDAFFLGLPGSAREDVASLSGRAGGLSPVRHLSRHNLLGPWLIAAHCVHLDDEDIALLGSNQVKVAHCPRSNARLGNGMAPIGKLLAAGVELGFGTDSAASCDDLDVLSEARFAWNLQRAVNPSNLLSAQNAIWRLTQGAAEILGLGDVIGSLKEGKAADIAIFAIPEVHASALERPFDLLVYGKPRLCDLYVNGRKVVNKDV